MRRIPLSLETYQHQSPALSSKLLLNMMAEQEPARCAGCGGAAAHAGVRELAQRRQRPDPRHQRRPARRNLRGIGNALLSGEPRRHDGDRPRRYRHAERGFTPDQRLYSIAVGPTAAVVCSPPNAFVSVGGASRRADHHDLAGLWRIERHLPRWLFRVHRAGQPAVFLHHASCSTRRWWTRWTSQRSTPSRMP